MSNYVRGQETFTYKVNSSISNFIGLLFFSIFFAFSAFFLLAYIRLPQAFWLAEKAMLREAFAYLKRNGPIYLPKAVEAFTRFSKTNVGSVESLLWENLYVAAGSAALLFWGLFAFFISRGRAIRGADYRRGSELIRPQDFNREYRHLIKSELKEIRQDNGGLLKKPSVTGC